MGAQTVPATLYPHAEDCQRRGRPWLACNCYVRTMPVASLLMVDIAPALAPVEG